MEEGAAVLRLSDVAAGEEAVSAQLLTLTAQVKYSTWYVCVDCQRQQVGDTVRVELSGLRSTEALKAELDARRQTSHSMPVGWSYDGEFHCGCKVDA